MERLNNLIDIARLIKDKYDQSREHIRDYSGLQAAFANELIVDSGNGIIRQKKH